MKNNKIKNSLEQINMSDDASRRILNNILYNKRQKNSFKKWSFVCTAAIIMFFVIFEGTLFSNNTRSFLIDILGLSTNYDNNIIGAIEQVENDDVIFKIEECFNDLNEVTFLISTKFKNINPTMSMDLIRVITNEGNTPSYTTLNCNLINNTLYTILIVQKNISYDKLIISLNNSIGLLELSKIEFNIDKINMVAVSIDKFDIIKDVSLNKIMFSQYAIYLCLDIFKEYVDDFKYSIYKNIKNENKIFITLTTNKNIYITDISVFSNYIIKDSNKNLHIVKYPFENIVELDTIKSITIGDKTFEIN